MKNLPTYEEFLNEGKNEINLKAIGQLRNHIESGMSKAKVFTQMVHKDGYDAIQIKSWLDKNYDSIVNESKESLKFKVIVKEGEATELILLNPIVFEEEDEEEEPDFVDIDIELEDETGKSLDDDDEEGLSERARPPKLTKRQRKANQVKGAATKKVLGPDSPIRSKIEKIFMLVKKEIRREASKQGVPIGQINLDRLTIKA